MTKSIGQQIAQDWAKSDAGKRLDLHELARMIDAKTCANIETNQHLMQTKDSDKTMADLYRIGIPTLPGYYWAKWKIPSEGTHEAEELTPSNMWEIVQVNSNHVNWELEPLEDEALSVAVPGVRETQWRDCFVWGDFISPILPIIDPQWRKVRKQCS